MLCIAQQNLSIGVNVVSEGSPSRMRRVRRISFGITILPKSSDLLTIPVAVPDIFVGFQKPSSSVDRGHSLRSLLPPPAALPSLPSCFHISISFSAAFLGPLFEGAGTAQAVTGGVSHRTNDTPSVICFANATSLKEGGKTAYNNFTNYAVSICKQRSIIPQDLLFQITVL